MKSFSRSINKQITVGDIIGRRCTWMSPEKYVVPGLKLTNIIPKIKPTIKAQIWEI